MGDGAVDGDGEALGSAAIALTHTKPIKATIIPIAFINYDYIASDR